MNAGYYIMKHGAQRPRIKGVERIRKMMKRLCFKLAALCAITGFLLTGCGSAGQGKDLEASQGTEAEKEVQTSQTEDKEGEDLLSGKHHVKIHIKDKGEILVELDADHAPVTVTNFINLAESGFYDGLTFHRIINGFMMQGGDPLGTGMGGSEQKIVGEFSNNGVDNPLSHTRGAISMARSAASMDSASSQFFIVHQDCVSLDGDYAVFGYVTEGMDIVDDICENTTGQDVNGVVPVENRPVIESIEVVD